MKKLICVLLVFTIFVTPFSAFAMRTGGAMGNYYATDIVTYVKGAPVTSYNIGGVTVIDAEVLNWAYGFDVYWYADERKLDVADKGTGFVSLQAMSGELVESTSEKDKIGERRGVYYATDIKTYLNGSVIESYNFGGRTFIVAEKMAEHGYNVIWNNDDRTLKIEFTDETFSTESDLGMVSTTDAGRLLKENFSFGQMTTVTNGSFNIEDKMLDVPGAKMYSTGWQNTRFVPLVKTLDAIGATYEWNNKDKIITINYDKTKPLLLTEKKNLEYSTVFTEENNYIKDAVSYTFPIKLVVNGEEFYNKTGLHQFRFSSSRNTIDAIIYEGIVYITSNTFADFMGYACDNGVDFFTKASPDFTNTLNSNMPKRENYMFSPLSIKLALGLLLNGADGETEAEIKNVLGINEAESFNNDNKKIAENLSVGIGYTLDIANAIWKNDDRAMSDFKEEYKNTLLEYYNADAKNVNDKNAVLEVNNWVSEKTNKKINSLISKPEFSYLLTNAVYFKGVWKAPFAKSLTQKDDFTDINGKNTQLDFMNKVLNARYLDENGIKATVLQYQNTEREGANDLIDYNRQMSMVIMMGDEKIENITEIVDKAIKSGVQRINLKLPKFELDFSTSLMPILSNMGMKNAFALDKADFSKMTDDKVEVTDAVHKTYIKVDEDGTEAAAITGIMVGATSVQQEKPIDLFFNKPFTYAIVEEKSGEILFVGQFVKE